MDYNMKDLNYKIKNYKDDYNSKILTIVLIGILGCIYFMDFLNSYIVNQSIFLLIYFIYIFCYKKSIKIPRYILPIIYFCIYLIINILIGGSVTFIIAFILNILVLIFLINTPNISIKVSKIMIIYSFIHLFFTLMIEIIPADITNTIFKFILGDRYSSNWYWRTQQNTNVGITIQPGNNALYITTLLSYCISHAITIEKYRKSYYIYSILAYLGILFTNKRAPLIVNIFSIVFIYLLYNRKNIDFNKFVKLLISVIIFIIIFIFIANKTNLFSGVLDKTRLLLESSNDISNGRYDLWQHALELFYKNAIFGVGFKSIYHDIGLDVHNVYLQILSEAGVIGFIIFCAAISLPIFRSINKLKYLNKYKDDNIKISILMGLYMSIYLLIYGLFSNVFLDYIPLGIFIFSIFMANSYPKKEVL